VRTAHPNLTLPATPMTSKTFSRRQLVALGLSPLSLIGLAACGGGTSENRPDSYTTLQLPTPVAQHTAVALGDAQLAVIGGSRGLGSFSASVNVIDGRTGAWTERALMSTGRTDARAVPIGSSELLVHGGARSLTGSRTAEWVDLRAGVSTPAVASPVRLHHTATLLRDGRVVVAGGWSTEGHPGGVSPSIELWDPVSRSWRYAARPMQQARLGHTATLMPDGSVLFVGGYTAGGMAASAERFDPASETTTRFASPLLARAGHLAAGQSDGRVLIAGGEQGLLAQPAAPGAVWLACEPCVAATVAGLPVLSETGAVGAALGDQLLLFGGTDAGGEAAATAWAVGAAPRRLPPMPEPRARHSATALPGVGVLVVGGEQGGRLLATALRYA
jgi:hypothetical protein